MKRITLLASFIWLFSFAVLTAQTIPPTGGGAASPNPPASWTGPTASTSNKTNYQGNAAQVWTSNPLPGAPGQVNTTFLSLYSKNSDISGAFVTLTGLAPGFTYEIKYDMMSAAAKIGASNTDWAYTGEIGIFNSTAQGWNNIASVSKQHQFTIADRSKWLSNVFTLTAKSTTAILGFRALGQTAKGSIVNLNINPGAIKVVCGVNPQVPLSKTSVYNKCFQPYANLNDAFTGVVPQGWTLHWFTNNTHSGGVLWFPGIINTPGDYYAFFYNGTCYNTNLSTAKVTVSINPALPSDGQVILSKSAIINECPVTTTVNLNNAFTGALPAGATLLWYTNPTHSGLPVADPAHASVLISTYYAFYYDVGNDCYNTANSTSFVKVTKRPCDQAAPSYFGLNENSETKSDIVIYPNPVRDEIQIKTADLDQISKIHIYDLTGLEVYKSGKVPTRTINVKHLSSGTYVVKMSKTNGTASSYKILVSK
ncbi:T9SS type A sorting domain-containing protein [Dyadobacter arcticus]|uniref:Secretion system C-terminal sorting domain-containing protein n=1 Tax=Dyadobacter arcticus TaxID=1078754 RepID=A0ABX0UP47_9BACT|nr:T9SS type A sorting domain-containing protein [Dyadobacter arcticus]NIJ54768.1 hypothetical protein [Dyadobacter arcticus]